MLFNFNIAHAWEEKCIKNKHVFSLSSIEKNLPCHSDNVQNLNTQALDTQDKKNSKCLHCEICSYNQIVFSNKNKNIAIKKKYSFFVFKNLTSQINKPTIHPHKFFS